jgi:DNA-binding PadR family transcriptional regulator
MLTPLGISVLALLNERSMHPYEMYQLLIERHEDRIVKVRPGSLYHTVERLVDHELVEAIGTDRSGNRPERTSYAITRRGQEALNRRVSELLREPVNEYPAFLVALSEAHNLDRDSVLALLAERDGNLQTLIDEITVVARGAQHEQVPEAYWLAADYLVAVHTTERDWLRRLADRIESKDLPWPTP